MSAPDATVGARIALAALTACVLGASALIAIAPADGGASGTGWVRLNSSALERAEPAAAAIGGSIYVVGGFIGPNTTNKAERYDADSDAGASSSRCRWR